jgi:hypothetical protein
MSQLTKILLIIIKTSLNPYATHSQKLKISLFILRTKYSSDATFDRGVPIERSIDLGYNIKCNCDVTKHKF